MTINKSSDENLDEKTEQKDEGQEMGSKNVHEYSGSRERFDGQHCCKHRPVINNVTLKTDKTLQIIEVACATS